MTVAIGLLGAGRIGKTHARAVADIPGAEIVAVYDPDAAAAQSVSDLSGARHVDVDGIMGDARIDAVIIATPTDLHAEQAEQAARAGKAIFCEKPIHLDVDRVCACLDAVDARGVPFMVGFNRRFDPHFAELRRQIAGGAVGEVELVQITSRDPQPPPIDYIKRSGGLFRDMMIHDFDMARFVLQEEIAEVSATGSVLIDAAIGRAGDYDTATATLKSVSGKVAVITNSRRASYGYDQRIEVHGSKGMIAADNVRATTVTVADDRGYRAEPLLDFFMQRYRDAYRLELAAFVDAVRNGAACVPGGVDGLRALEIADAATRATADGRTIAVQAG